MDPPAARLFTVGEVGAHRADGRAKAPAEARADGGLEVSGVPGVAGVDEGRGAPAVGEPLDVLGAADREVAPADHGVAQAHAEALEGVAAHRVVAAGAE